MKTEWHVKTITHIPGWAQEETNTDKISNVSAAYRYVPVTFRALRLRCDALASVPVRVTKKGGTGKVEWPFPAVDVKRLVWMTQAGLLMKGAAFWEKIGRGRRVVDLQLLNPFSMDVEMVNGQLVFSQKVNGQEKGKWGLESMVYIREYHPTDDIHPGISAMQVALGDAALMRYMTRFASYFFESGAMPVTVLGVDGAVSEDERQRIDNFFKRAMSGIKNAWRTLTLRANISSTVLTPKIEEMVIPELSKRVLFNIASAFQVPVTMLDDAANFATAKEHRESFWSESVRPAGEMIEGVINQQLFNPMGLKFEFAFDELDVYREDEAARAQSLLSLRQSGLDLELGMRVLGYDLTEEQWERVITLSKELTEKENKPISPFFVPQAGGNSREEEQEENVGDEVRADLRRWMDKSLKRVKRGQGLAFEFRSECIPAGLMGAISGALEEAEAAADVRGIFYDAMRVEGESKALKKLNVKEEEVKPVQVVIPEIRVEFPGEVKMEMPDSLRQALEKRQEPPVVVVNVPEQAAPQVVVNIPEQKAPEVTVNIPEQKAPVVNVTMPEAKPKKIVRDRQGRVVEIVNKE